MTAPDPPPQSPDPTNDDTKRPKLRSTCDNCQAVKTRCSRDRPRCYRCQVHDVPCNYSLSKRMGRPRRSQQPGQEQTAPKKRRNAAGSATSVSKQSQTIGDGTEALNERQVKRSSSGTDGYTNQFSHELVDQPRTTYNTSFKSYAQRTDALPDHEGSISTSPHSEAFLTHLSKQKQDGKSTWPPFAPQTTSSMDLGFLGNSPFSFSLDPSLLNHTTSFDQNSPEQEEGAFGAIPNYAFHAPVEHDISAIPNSHLLLSPLDDNENELGSSATTTEDSSTTNDLCDQNALSSLGDLSDLDFSFLDNNGYQRQEHYKTSLVTQRDRIWMTESRENVFQGPKSSPQAENAQCDCLNMVLSRLKDLSERPPNSCLPKMDRLMAMSDDLQKQTTVILQCTQCLETKSNLILLLALAIDNLVCLLESIFFGRRRRTPYGSSRSQTASPRTEHQTFSEDLSSLASCKLLIGSYQVSFGDGASFVKQLLRNKMSRLCSALDELRVSLQQTRLTTSSKVGATMAVEIFKRLQSVVGRVELYNV